jgi:hypothetical protein
MVAVGKLCGRQERPRTPAGPSAWKRLTHWLTVFTLIPNSVATWRLGRPRHTRTMSTALVLDALEPALRARQAGHGLIHHRDRGSHYLSIRYSERLAEVSIEASRIDRQRAAGRVRTGISSTQRGSGDGRLSQPPEPLGIPGGSSGQSQRVLGTPASPVCGTLYPPSAR